MYLDETWANARDSVEKMWVEDDPVVSGGPVVPSEGFVSHQGRKTAPC